MLRGARRLHLGFARFTVQWLSRGARLAQQNEWMSRGWPGKSSSRGPWRERLHGADARLRTS